MAALRAQHTAARATLAQQRNWGAECRERSIGVARLRSALDAAPFWCTRSLPDAAAHPIGALALSRAFPKLSGALGLVALCPTPSGAGGGAESRPRAQFFAKRDECLDLKTMARAQVNFCGSCERCPTLEDQLEAFRNFAHLVSRYHVASGGWGNQITQYKRRLRAHKVRTVRRLRFTAALLAPALPYALPPTPTPTRLSHDRMNLCNATFGDCSNRCSVPKALQLEC